MESSRYTPLGEEHLRLEPVVDGADSGLLDREAWGDVSGLIADAIGHVPAQTRVMVAERFLDERSVEEVAERHGLTENAVRVRLHRGRQQLQTVFRTRVRVEADAPALLPDRAGEKEETRIWCPYCGACKLRGYFDTAPGRERFALDCPGCTAKPGCTSIGVAFTSRQATLPSGKSWGVCGCTGPPCAASKSGGASTSGRRSNRDAGRA